MTFRWIAALAIAAAPEAGSIGFAFAEGDQAPAEMSAPTAADSGPGADLPVLLVTGLEILQTQIEPKLDIVRVTGLVASGGWSAPLLVPIYAGKPFDGVLDLQLIATPPLQSQPADGFEPVDAMFSLQEEHQFRGIRVRGGENAIEIDQIPGSARAKVELRDCNDCVGRKFVAATAAQPGSAGSIREQDLPKPLRVIRPSDGIRAARPNPNRLTLILGGDDTIVAAFWE